MLDGSVNMILRFSTLPAMLDDLFNWSWRKQYVGWMQTAVFIVMLLLFRNWNKIFHLLCRATSQGIVFYILYVLKIHESLLSHWSNSPMFGGGHTNAIRERSSQPSRSRNGWFSFDAALLYSIIRVDLHLVFPPYPCYSVWLVVDCLF